MALKDEDLKKAIVDKTSIIDPASSTAVGDTHNAMASAISEYIPANAVVSGIFNGTIGGSPIPPVPVSMLLSGSISGPALQLAATGGFAAWSAAVSIELVKLQVQQPTGFSGAPGIVASAFLLVPLGTEDSNAMILKMAKSFNDFFKNGAVAPMPSTLVASGAVGTITVNSIN